MQLGGNRRPGVTTAFIDPSSGETLLAVRTNAAGQHSVLFRLSDCTGAVVADSDGFAPYEGVLVIMGDRQKLLLRLPEDPSGVVSYCLYNRRGDLLTESDGARTKLYRGVQMQASVEATEPGGRRPPPRPPAKESVESVSSGSAQPSNEPAT